MKMSEYKSLTFLSPSVGHLWTFDCVAKQRENILR